MNKQNNKDKIFDAIIKICLAILIYTICKFAFDNLFTDNFTIFDERIDKYEEYIKDNDDKNIKYMLNYNVNGEMTLYTLEDYVNAAISIVFLCPFIKLASLEYCSKTVLTFSL